MRFLLGEHRQKPLPQQIINFTCLGLDFKAATNAGDTKLCAHTYIKQAPKTTPAWFHAVQHLQRVCLDSENEDRKHETGMFELIS